MKRKTLLSVALAFVATVALAAIADLSGKWVGSVKDPDGNDHSIHLVFKVDGEKLTGTAQADGDPQNIEEGKVTGNDFSFKVTTHDGDAIPVYGKYVAEGDSVSLNFEQNGGKFHLTLKRDNN
ncbi:MAG: glycoside hydrolase [Bacteroidetes bacterium]|nr:glycoside hydrolase [Bacteroidota bacterium]